MVLTLSIRSHDKKNHYTLSDVSENETIGWVLEQLRANHKIANNMVVMQNYRELKQSR